MLIASNDLNAWFCRFSLETIFYSFVLRCDNMLVTPSVHCVHILGFPLAGQAQCARGQTLVHLPVLSAFQSCEGTARTQGTVETPHWVMVLLFYWSLSSPPSSVLGLVLVIQCCVLQLVSSLLMLLCVCVCLLAALHRLLISYMNHSSDKNRLNLKLFI